METKSNPVRGTSFEFLGIGWWVWHIFAIAVTFYLGHLFYPR